MKRPDAAGLALDDLTVPRPGSTTLREIWSRALRGVLLDLLTLHPPTSRTAWPSMRAALVTLAKANPGALFSALRLPSIGTRIRCLRDSGRDDIDRTHVFDGLHAALADALGAAWSGPPAPAASFTSWPRRAVRRDGDWVDTDADGPLFVDITGDVVLCRGDDSPLALHEAHPDKDGNRASLGGRPVALWKTSLKRAFEAIAVALPPLHDEMALAFRQVVPVGFDPERHLSASFRENLGTAYLSLHPADITMVEALVHEFSHNKLNALFELDPVLHNAFSPLYSSPVRPDPRPLHGVLLAVHAFVAVAAVHRGLRRVGHSLAKHPAFDERLASIEVGNREGLETLQNAQPTAAGRTLLDELSRLATVG